MAYTNVWSDVIPAGSAQAATIDDQIRQLRLDVRERMDTILDTGKKWTDDPIGIPSQSGTVVGRHVYISPYDIQSVADEDDVVRQWGGAGYYLTNGSGLVSVCPLRLPIGVTLTRLEYLVLQNTVSDSLAVRFYKRLWGVPGPVSQVGPTLTSVGTGAIVLADSGAASYSEVLDESTYWIENIPSGPASQYRLYGYRLTVNVPDAGSVV